MFHVIGESELALKPEHAPCFLGSHFSSTTLAKLGSALTKAYFLE